MKVILKEEIKGLGKKENMVDVNDGYARNFLIPRGLAVEANASNLNVMNTKKQAEKSKKDREFAAAKELAKRIQTLTLVLKTKSGENGKLFGSITSKDIAEKLKSEHKIDVDKKKMHLEESIKSIGTYEIEIKLYPEVITKLKIQVTTE